MKLFFFSFFVLNLLLPLESFAGPVRGLHRKTVGVKHSLETVGIVTDETSGDSEKDCSFENLRQSMNLISLDLFCSMNTNVRSCQEMVRSTFDRGGLGLESAVSALNYSRGDTTADRMEHARNHGSDFAKTEVKEDLIARTARNRALNRFVAREIPNATTSELWKRLARSRMASFAKRTVARSGLAAIPEPVSTTGAVAWQALDTGTLLYDIYNLYRNSNCISTANRSVTQSNVSGNCKSIQSPQYYPQLMNFLTMPQAQQKAEWDKLSQKDPGLQRKVCSVFKNLEQKQIGMKLNCTDNGEITGNLSPDKNEFKYNEFHLQRSTVDGQDGLLMFFPRAIDGKRELASGNKLGTIYYPDNMSLPTACVAFQNSLMGTILNSPIDGKHCMKKTRFDGTSLDATISPGVDIDFGSNLYKGGTFTPPAHCSDLQNQMSAAGEKFNKAAELAQAEETKNPLASDHPRLARRAMMARRARDLLQAKYNEECVDNPTPIEDNTRNGKTFHHIVSNNVNFALGMECCDKKSKVPNSICSRFLGPDDMNDRPQQADPRSPGGSDN